MKKIITIINPFKKDLGDIPKEVYVIKKILSFIVIFIASMIIGEAIVILGLKIADYDFLHGEMPGDNAMTLIKYYGFSIHSVITILFCKFIEKRNLKSMGIVKNKFVKSYFLGTVIGVTLLLSIIILCVFSGAVVYNGANSDINMLLILAYLGGFVIQGTMEEIMCRGFLMNSLLHKVPRNMAILISSIMFALPHFPTLFQFSIINIIAGIVNLLLFSTIVSLLMIKHNNIWVSCAVHSVWNFTLAIIIGINVSGSKDLLSLFDFTANENMKLLSGGQYGIEAGVICTIVLIVFVIVLYRKVE